MTLRSPDQVMRLARMGAAFPTRLSFMRSLVRRMTRENWRFEIPQFDVDADGFGTSVLSVHTPDRTYSLLVFTHDLPPEKRTDRVIAEAWDATFNLIDGTPEAADIERLRANTPRQEAGRYSPKELVLARANKSVRLFGHVVDALAAGRQPDSELIRSVGYLMRTTAVYGNGKFGIADRARIADRAEAEGSFQIEMLAVYLFRWFTIEWVQHIARARGGERAASLDPDITRYLGIGNATGLGMAPFLVRHPALVHRWVKARETALSRVRAIENPSPASVAGFQKAWEAARRHVAEWRVDDALQTERIETLRSDLDRLGPASAHMIEDAPFPWDRLYRTAEEGCSVEAQELVVSLLLEPHGDLIDDLADGLFADEAPRFDPAEACGKLLDTVQQHYRWALDIDFAPASANARFWYYSEEKLEPRLGDRHSEPGAELEMPLAVARDVQALATGLSRAPAEQPIGRLIAARPDLMQVARRVQTVGPLAYAEIRDNLIAEDMRPIDILRFKLAFFGASKFDPKSDLWTRISMFQGTPLPAHLCRETGEGWPLAARLAAA